jgi:hypothetical protein
MQGERSCAAGRSDGLQRVILDLLLTDRSPGLWTTDEVGLAVGDPLAAGDAIAELHAFGLLHLCGGHVCPSRAAVRFDQLSEEVKP